MLVLSSPSLIPLSLFVSDVFSLACWPLFA
jgi:hypothetical protein